MQLSARRSLSRISWSDSEEDTRSDAHRMKKILKFESSVFAVTAGALRHTEFLCNELFETMELPWFGEFDSAISQYNAISSISTAQ
jgi:hypothetical protein